VPQAIRRVLRKVTFPPSNYFDAKDSSKIFPAEKGRILHEKQYLLFIGEFKGGGGAFWEIFQSVGIFSTRTSYKIFNLVAFMRREVAGLN
jgi:hypothetical protein